MRRNYLRIKWESSYIIKGKRGKYLVSYEKLKNSYYGNPRYKMKITALEHNDMEYKTTASIIWNGHYISEYQECEMVVKEYERIIDNKE